MALAQALDAIEQFVNASSEVQRIALPDGSHKILQARPKGPSFTVLHEPAGGGEPSVVHETAHADVAASVFDAFDGTTPGWARAYHPRGGLPVEKADVTMPVLAVGVTPEDCVRSFLSRGGETLAPGTYEGSDEGGDLGPDARFQWEARFSGEESGTGFRAAGVAVPGGYVMTWVS